MLKRKCSNVAETMGRKDKNGWHCRMVAKYSWMEKGRRDVEAIVTDKDGRRVMRNTICGGEISERACMQQIRIARELTGVKE